MLEVKIKGDSNDADYEHCIHTISSLEETVLYRLNLEHDDLILSISFNWNDLLKHLAYAFKKTSETNPEKSDKTNWYRPEFDDFEEHSQDIHRRGSSFYRKSIVHISKEWNPELPEEFFGYWETNVYTYDSVYGYVRSDIYELRRVEKRKRIVEVFEWIEV